MRPRSWITLGCLLLVFVVVVPVVLVATLASVRPQALSGSVSRSGILVDALPELARTMLPLVRSLVGDRCPELPVIRVIAEVHAESGWNPRAWSEDSNGGAAGLLQINRANWVGLGGRAWTSVPPPPNADVLEPSVHLSLGVNFLCANLRAMTSHLKASGKPLDPADAMSVCHIAGCGRVLNSATGIPEAGEAGCGARCAGLIRQYLDNIHEFERMWSTGGSGGAPGSPGTLPPGVDVAGLPAAEQFPGGPPGCLADDPTSTGCVSAATRHAHEQLVTVFGAGIRSSGCWSRRPWNPTSDHPLGRACDVFFDRPGVFPSGEPLRVGWQVAAWLRQHAGPLRVKYVIWQGRYWDPGIGDEGGWGARYSGGGVYDVADATGGHYDHVHVSFAE